MSLLNSSPKEQSSSTTITPPPPIETILNENDDPESSTSSPLPSLSWSQFDQHVSTNIEPPHLMKQPMDRQQLRSQIPNAINTDYESSATEDFETFTSSKYENAECALLSYARTNKLEKLQILLESKFKNEISLDLNFKGQQKQNFSWSALHLACYFGHFRVVELLLSKKQYCDELDINIQNNSGDTPLHKATLTNRAEIVQLLLSKDANVFIKNCDGLLAKHLTKDRHILNMLEAAEQVDKNRTIQAMFKAVDNGDLKKLQEYFENYGQYNEFSKSIDESNDDDAEVRNTEDPVNNTNRDHGIETNDQSENLSRTTDGRGNTLLHLAAMRGFKAICVYLLEQGFDPYKKNHLGQSSIDLSSYQLRQLFTTVKPANNHLKKLSAQRVTRFEGPLLKKVRILGWRQIYVVLENGVILLFNNRRDSMNKSRRGYKYLESATCEPDTNDLGTFTVSFSDRSRVTFLVSSDHLNNYTSYKTSSTDQEKGVSSSNQIELIRQKWIDSIRDHIRYSTDFIKNGLKLNDYDEENDNYNNDGDLSSLNHLLPIDTIKSFMQEARAHYSILERHAESLCNLIQTINSSNRHKQSIESSHREDDAQPVDVQPAITSTTTTSNRLLSFIRPSRQTRTSSISGDDGAAQNQQQLVAGISRKRNDSLTNEFLQDNWHCILFHLRLLMESTENTKVSMGQALALIEHQEQLRQNRIQDQEERCRVLEDSLHALARDHHELEKSISMSQLYHSAAARSLSMSMSTDLNEYFDAFEDFDDANSRTLTPTSMPTDEDLDSRIQEVMSESQSNQPQFSSGEPSLPAGETTTDEDDDDDEDDLRSNCSALTVETVSEISAATIGNRTNIGTLASSVFDNKSRTRLPCPMVPRDQVSIWSILKNCIGKELSKITMPVVFNEPLTMLQRACECIQFSRYLKMADESDDPVERMEMICTFIVAGLSANCHRIVKPFNPLLYETFEYDHELEDGSHVKALAQQVSHHPPITAAYCESENFIYNGSVNPKIKFWGRSIEVQPDGQCRIYLKRHNETYIFKSVTCSVHNIIVGKLWFEHKGPLDVKCIETNMQANLNFKQAGWFSSDLHRFDGHIVKPAGKDMKKMRFVYGKWSDYIKSVDYSEYENYMKDSQQKLFRIPDNPYQGHTSNGTHGSPNSINNNSIPNATHQGDAVGSSSANTIASKAGEKGSFSKSESSQSLDIPNSRTLWRLESQYLEEYYNFTHFTMKLNELSSGMAQLLPKTDSRFRPDVRKLEEGDLDGAASEKQRLEEKQREARARDKRFKDPSPDMLWFDLKDVQPSKEKFWIYKGGYWESKCNPEKFPDIF